MSPKTRYLGHFTGLAHRGGGLEAMENSVAAFTNAAAMGYDVIETDIQVSRDGTVYIFHDDTLDRTTNGNGPFVEKSDAELAALRLNDGGVIPTLSMMRAAIPHVIFNIDVKTDACITPIASYLNTHGGHDQICLASFSTRRLNAVRALLDQPCTFSGGQADVLRLYLGALGLPMGRPDIIAAQVPTSHYGLDIITPRFINHCRRLDIAVHVWTINDADKMRRLLALGVDGIVTDRPSLLKDIALEMGIKIAPDA